MSEPLPMLAAPPGPDAASPFAAVPYDDLLRCIRCGFCLPACPTYALTAREPSSPRGRLALMKAAAEGGLEVTPRLAEELFFCLECRACETACPAGVPFGRVMDAAREALHERGLSPVTASPLGRLALRHLIPHPRRLRRLASIVGWAQRSGTLAAVRRALPQLLGEQALALPPLPRRRPLQPRYEPRGRRRARVALFTGCVADALMPGTHVATAEVLARFGAEVVVVPGQTCCGALHVHAGDGDFARELARRNVAAFEAAGADFVVSNAGGCGAALREYGELLRDDPSWAARASAFAERCRDASEVLAELAPAGGALGRLDPPVRATLQDSCHLLHVQGVQAAPRALLGRVEGLTLVEMAGADRCCGSAGIWSLTHAEASARILQGKIEAVSAAGADVVVTANPGCLIQMRWGVLRAGLEGRVRVTHLMDLLWEAVRNADGAANPA